MKRKMTIFVYLILMMLVNNYVYGQAEPRAPATSASSTKEFNFADNKKQTSMMPIMGDALPFIQYLEDTMNVEIVRLEYDLIFDKKVTYRTLYEGWNYGIVVIGDYRIKKINVHLYKYVNDQWSFIRSGKGNDYFSMVSEKPEEKGDYLMQITADEFEEGYKAGHYAIIIYH